MSDTPDDDFDDFAEPDGPGYGMVMPFVSVKSQGGPYDDDAFCAGYQMGLLDAELGGSVFEQGRGIFTANKDQADLIAMRHGFIAEFAVSPAFPEWAVMTVRRAVEVPE